MAQTKKFNTRRLVESALFIAIGFLLSYFKLEIMPSASISLLSMLPILLLAYKYGAVWGMFCGLIHGILQMIEGGVSVPTEDFMSYLLVILLDYLLAFSLLGLAGLFRGIFKNPSVNIAVCSAIGIFGRFICSFLSGWIIWGVYAPEGQSAFVYSLVVNGTKFGVEGAYTIVIAAILIAVPVIKKNIALPKLTKAA